MNYLVDTHVFIWTITDTAKLSPAVKKIIEDPQNDIFISTITFWEISLKFGLKKIVINSITPQSLPDMAMKMGFKIIPLDALISSSYHQLPLNQHKDPFDRMLIWQAIKRNYILISKDPGMDQYKDNGLETVWH